ncbi:MAG: 2,3-bisphosphoglycerate-independent phosphoglycerate mutase, partial [Proteobacteria bacterium]
MTSQATASQKALLIVLDGFGIGKDSPFNSIRKARKPFFDSLLKKYPHSELLTHGNAVGLPDGVMGNSEVGHMTMGAGRILYQDLTRITKSITEGSFNREQALVALNSRLIESSGRIHLMGLLSDGGVHSHIGHLEALMDFFCSTGAKEIYIHAFLDGRDTAPGSAAKFLKRIQDKIEVLRTNGAQSQIKIASIGGRYFAMDRDNRWDRVEKAYKVLTGDAPVVELEALAAFE